MESILKQYPQENQMYFEEKSENNFGSWTLDCFRLASALIIWAIWK